MGARLCRPRSGLPKDGDCSPGFGEIDHSELLDLAAFTGRGCRYAELSPKGSTRSPTAPASSSNS